MITQEMKDTFMSLQDPTGVTFGDKYCGGYSLLIQELSSSKRAQSLFTAWQDELEARMQSTALRTIKELAEDGADAQRMQAAKYIAEKGWKKDTKGRPSKETISKAIEEEKESKKTLLSDYERIQLRN